MALVGDAGGLYSPHLHFEIRDANHPDHMVPGTGYTDIQLSEGETGPQGQIDPNAFITSHMQRPVGEPVVREFANFCTPEIGFVGCATIRIETQPLVDSDGGVVGTAGVVFVHNLQGVHPSDNSGGSAMAGMGIGGDVGLFGEEEGYMEEVWLVTDGLELRRPSPYGAWPPEAWTGVGWRYFDLPGSEPPLADWIRFSQYAIEGCDDADWGPDGSQPPVYVSCAPDGFPGSAGLRFNTHGVWTAEDIHVIRWEAFTFREGSPYGLWTRCWIFPSGEDPTEGTNYACTQTPIN